ncbi:MAG: DMT family transporter [Solirubrobacterales bacterium]|jgi:drug/metabolite transporter (DMT)-like permease
MDRRSWTLLVVLAAIWGASFLFIEIALRDLAPGLLAWTRITLAAIVLTGMAIVSGSLSGLRERVGGIMVLAAVQVAGPFLLIAAGQQEITSSLAGILMTTAPIFGAVLAIWVDREERSTGLRLVGIILGFAGVVVLLGLDLDGSAMALVGGLAVVLGGLGYAVGGFIIKKRFGDYEPLGVAAAVMTGSAVWLLPAALLSIPPDAPSAGPLLAVVALGVVGTGFAFAIYYELFATVGPARTLLVAYLIPGFAVIYGAVFLDERITLVTIIGLALILAGSWLAAEGRMPGRQAAAGAPAAVTPPEAAVPDYS